MQAIEFEIFLNNLLKPKQIKDYCPNGLQVQGSDEIKKVIKFLEENVGKSIKYRKIKKSEDVPEDIILRLFIIRKSDNDLGTKFTLAVDYPIRSMDYAKYGDLKFKTKKSVIVVIQIYKKEKLNGFISMFCKKSRAGNISTALNMIVRKKYKLNEQPIRFCEFDLNKHEFDLDLLTFWVSNG